MMMGVIVIIVSTIVEYVVDFDRRWIMVDEEVTVKSTYIVIDELPSKHMYANEIFILSSILFII